MQKILKITDLTLHYGDFQALKNINLLINKQQVCALIGPSGCGKSTFLRCLNRLHDLNDSVRISGSIHYSNQDIYHKKHDVIRLRKQIGMVFQKANPFPMSIYENVAYGLKLEGLKNKQELDKIVEASLCKAALWDEVKDCLNKSALSLSGGQQQRLCIARAIALQPDIILMDEPTSALDPIATAKIEALINELRKDYTIIIVTHSMHQAHRIADYTAFFLNGEIVEYGKTCQIFENPQTKQCADYIKGRFG